MEVFGDFVVCSGKCGDTVAFYFELLMSSDAFERVGP